MAPLPLPPRIETARLVLRPWAIPDVDALHAALGESVEHLLPWIPWATPRAPSPEETRALLDEWIAQRESGHNFMYAILGSDNGRLLGGIGLYARVGPGRLEIGYWLRRTASGFGFATEATSAITAAGFDVPGVEGLEIHTDPRNAASIRIPVKLGYRRLRPGADDGGEKDAATRDTVIFVLERGPGGSGRPAPDPAATTEEG